MSSIVIQLDPFIKHFQSTSDPVVLTTYIFPTKQCCTERDNQLLTLTYKSEDKQQQFKDVATQTDTGEMAAFVRKQRKDAADQKRKEVIDAILQDHFKAELLETGVKPKFRISYKSKKCPKHLTNPAKERFMAQLRVHRQQHSSNQTQIESKSLNMPSLDTSTESNLDPNLCATETSFHKSSKVMIEKPNAETMRKLEEYGTNEYWEKQSRKHDMMIAILRESVQDINNALKGHNLRKCTDLKNTQEIRTGLLTNMDAVKELCIRRKCCVKLKRCTGVAEEGPYSRTRSLPPRRCTLRTCLQ